MARTNVTDVKAILDDTTLTDAQVEAYIESANVFVTDVLSGAGLSTDALKDIERWITAHMIASTRERQIKKAGAGGAEVEYTGYWSVGLLGTTYGQTAVLFDTSGTLQALAQNKLAAWSKAVPTENIYD